MSTKDDINHRLGHEKIHASKTSSTISALSKLLDAIPAAEELSTSWSRSQSESLNSAGPRLKDLKVALDSGRLLGSDQPPRRGIPMWIVVRTCKASWHQDGTWPLLACDEVIETDASLQGAIRSIHTSANVLRPQNLTQFVAPIAEEGTKRKPEASMDQIAAAYRRRGIPVEEAVIIEDDW